MSIAFPNRDSIRRFSQIRIFLPRQGSAWAAILAAVLFWAGLALPVNGQTNSWTGSASGNWEDANWSLGVLPGPGQTILITNAGWKAVAIESNTAQNFPGTLTVDSITISSPANSFNTLLLDDAGLGSPLSANSLMVASNSAVVMNGSSLQVSNVIRVEGAFTQNSASVVTNLSLDVESVGLSGYNLNSGLLISRFGEDVGLAVPSLFTQAGGTNHAFGLRLYTNSEYDLNGGWLDGAIILRANARFKQQGGTVDNSASSDNIVSIDGGFFLSGGSFIGAKGAGMFLPGYSLLHRLGISGTALQTGGTNEEYNLVLGFQEPPENADTGGNVPGESGTYTLSNGVVTTAGTIVAGNGNMEQAGGTHTVNGSLAIQGSLYYYNGIVNRSIVGVYDLDGGMLSADDISVGVAATFSQSGGTNHVAGDIALTRSTDPIGYFHHGRYHLYNGELAASNILVAGGELSQAGGRLIISNDFQLADTAFQQSGGQVTQSGVFTLANAYWYPASGSQQMGRLQLGVSDSAASILTLPAGANVLQLADSSGLVWSNQAVLNIFDWSGSLYGGGNQRIIFGNNAGGLTSQQLHQITFANPAGLAAGTYPARILATGEIVPDTGNALPVTMAVAGQSNAMLQITIGGQIGSNYVVQTSTDLVHWVPWTTQSDSTGTISVSDRVTNAPERFYRAVAVP
jgi:hypothetical protein